MPTSASEHGTLYQLKNLIHRTNVVFKPSTDFDACNDFFILVVTCHVLTAAMSILGMESLSATPSNDVIPDVQNVWMLAHQERKITLDKLCEEIIDKFRFHNTAHACSDQVHNYNTLLLSIGCFYLEFVDAIKEGDGKRYSGAGDIFFQSLEVLAVPIIPLKFSICCANMTLSSHQEWLIWSRFINVHGIPGRYIPADLYMEHLNRLCKEAIHGLGGNTTEKTICHIGKSLGTPSESIRC